MTLSRLTAKPCLYRFAGCLAFALLFALVLVRAWVADDAYITFRVVDNFVHGYGLRWNTDERVQVYTHPLWMLLHIPFYALTGNIYITTIALSLACFFSAVVIAARCSGYSFFHAGLTFVLPLCLMGAVLDYACSGLENPLAMLLALLFALRFCTHAEYSPQCWFVMSLTSALLLMTRLDFALLVAPAWLWLLTTGRRTTRQLVLGWLPLLVWASFCLWYYGSVFPNTKYAKLNTGIPAGALLAQGLNYVKMLLLYDVGSFMLLVALCAGTAYGLIRLAFSSVNDRKSVRLVLLAAGVSFYCSYVVAVGGDFMSGRLFAVPVFITVWVGSVLAQRYLLHTSRQWAAWVFGLVMLAILTTDRHMDAENMCQAAVSDMVCTINGITDERHFYYPHTGLFRDGMTLRTEADGEWVEAGRLLRQTTSSSALTAHTIGVYGFYAGPEVKLVDIYSLADPLLARLPMKNDPQWRIGHFKRDLPKGYMQARASGGDLSAMEPALAAYYAALHEITSGELFSAFRLHTLLTFQLGGYDDVLNEYIKQHCSEYYGCQSTSTGQP